MLIRQLLAATSIAGLLAGVATAQDAGTTTTTTTPPAATPAPVTPDPAAAIPSAPAMPPATAQGQVVPPAEVPAAPAATAATPAPAPAAETAMPPAPAEGQAPAADMAGPAVMPPSAPAADVAATPPAGTGPASVSADDMMGRAVRGSDGEPLGRVSDVVIDSATGKIQRLVIASGGFLGIGAKNVALDFTQVEIRPEGGIVANGVTQADVEKMPTYDVAAETKTLSAPPPAAVAPAGGPAAGVTPATTGGASEPSTANPNLGVGGAANQSAPPPAQ
jgi:sporulation protein YlmC with PRC-barrel domain